MVGWWGEWLVDQLVEIVMQYLQVVDNWSVAEMTFHYVVWQTIGWPFGREVVRSNNTSEFKWSVKLTECMYVY